MNAEKRGMCHLTLSFIRCKSYQMWMQEKEFVVKKVAHVFEPTNGVS